MRLAVFHDLPSGGAKRALHAFVGQLSSAHQLDVFTPETAEETFCDLRPLVRAVHRYPFAPPGHERWRGASLVRLVEDWRSMFVSLRRLHRRMAADIDAGGYDAVFVNQSQYTQSPYLLCDLLTPSVYYCQEPRRASFEYGLKPSMDGGLAYRARLRLFESALTRNDIASARSASLVAVSSAYSAESVKRSYGIDARLCPLGVDFHTFRDQGLPRDRVVLSVGGLHPFKGHELVIRSVGLLPAGIRPSVRIIADRGPESEAERVREAAHRAGVELHVDRAVTDAALVDAYGRARLTVCAADLEPFGLVPLESMACATPVVAVREGGYRETVVDGRNGLLVERDPRALADAVERAMDGSTWPRLSRSAQADARRWSWDRAGERLVELFEMVAGSDAGSRP